MIFSKEKVAEKPSSVCSKPVVQPKRLSQNSLTESGKQVGSSSSLKHQSCDSINESFSEEEEDLPPLSDDTDEKNQIRAASEADANRDKSGKPCGKKRSKNIKDVNK